jgi:hypothetical protein
MCTKVIWCQDVKMHNCLTYYTFQSFSEKFYSIQNQNVTIYVRENMCLDNFQLGDEEIYFHSDTIHINPLKKSAASESIYQRILLMINMEDEYKRGQMKTDLLLSDYFSLPFNIQKGKFYNGSFGHNNSIIFFENAFIKSDCELNMLNFKISKSKMPGLYKYKAYCNNKNIFTFYLTPLYNKVPFEILDYIKNR